MRRTVTVAYTVATAGLIAGLTAISATWFMVTVDFWYALRPVLRWPLLPMVATIPVITVLIPFAAARLRNNELVLIHCFVWMWFYLFTFAPSGALAGGISPALPWSLACLSQYFAARMVARKIAASETAGSVSG